MISILFLKLYFEVLTIFPHLAIYSEPLCATYASFGGRGPHISTLLNGWLQGVYM